VLGIGAYPVNWPLGTGTQFRGVWDRQTRLAHFYERTTGGQFKAPVETVGLDDPEVRERLDEASFNAAHDELEMLDGAGAEFDAAAVLAGKTTPVYFGSAVNNFGVQLLLDGFVEHSSTPRGRVSHAGGEERLIEPENPAFSGFVFKIQANMDPRHRDRVAFIRVVSGKFERDMAAVHPRIEKPVRLSNSSKLFGRERETVDEAWPGDVVGIVGANYLAIGDTLASEPGIQYDEIPHFPPEVFAFLHNPTPSNYKRFREGLTQLLQEGVVHAYELPNGRAPLLAAVGPLQFEIVQYRLQSEYNAESRLEMANWALARWVTLPADGKLTHESIMLPTGVNWATDGSGNRLLLFPNAWVVDFFMQKNEGVTLSDYPPHVISTSRTADR
jgi:peptide chain release factor 3